MVLPIFLEWIVTTTSDISNATGIRIVGGNSLSNSLIVLVAHNGYSFDFPILFAEHVGFNQAFALN